MAAGWLLHRSRMLLLRIVLFSSISQPDIVVVYCCIFLLLRIVVFALLSLSIAAATAAVVVIIHHHQRPSPSLTVHRMCRLRSSPASPQNSKHHSSFINHSPHAPSVASARSSIGRRRTSSSRHRHTNNICGTIINVLFII